MLNQIQEIMIFKKYHMTPLSTNVPGGLERSMTLIGL